MNFGRHRFSWTWVFISVAIFVAAEVLLGGLVGKLVVGRYASMSLRFLLQGALNLASYFVGGMLVGIISPRVRILEPAVGAFISVSAMLFMALFTPYSFIRFSTFKMVIGGGVAFLLALSGARLGERLVGNR